MDFLLDRAVLLSELLAFWPIRRDFMLQEVTTLRDSSMANSKTLKTREDMLYYGQNKLAMSL
jgi:hypothetical protein